MATASFAYAARRSDCAQGSAGTDKIDRVRSRSDGMHNHDWNSGRFLVENMHVELRAWGIRIERLPTTDVENAKEQSMKLQSWDATILQMIEESNREPKESGKYKVLIEWRSKLSKEPHSLQPFQIDEIIREFRKRLTNAALQAATTTARPVPTT